ncbi:hypothetical protein GA0070563_107168 [Micromonospora carbonacea]|uniref:Uncharacterized protein n=1 Tax=Micromonospora carbonacea TaxID=47853 RepID=A0A1C4Z2S0_9ACTN|nr:hypothetical protein GA0070563_107168 [Micromonospora carbonacea]
MRRIVVLDVRESVYFGLDPAGGLLDGYGLVERA